MSWMRVIASSVARQRAELMAATGQFLVSLDNPPGVPGCDA